MFCEVTADFPYIRFGLVTLFEKGWVQGIAIFFFEKLSRFVLKKSKKSANHSIVLYLMSIPTSVFIFTLETNLKVCGPVR